MIKGLHVITAILIWAMLFRSEGLRVLSLALLIWGVAPAYLVVFIHRSKQRLAFTA